MENSKGILFKLTFLLILACAACARSTHKVTYYLTQAEELVWTSPDSALQLLKSIPTPEKLTGKEQADYALLLTLAQYRCNIPISSDSLVNLAVEYYKDKNNADKKGEALYVRGCLLEEIHKDISNALIAYKEAEKCIPYMKKAPLIARIYSSLGYLNKNSFNFEPAKEYYQKALQINIAAKDTASQASNLLNLLGLYHIIQNIDNANLCISNLLQISRNVKDSALQAKIYHNIATSKMYQEENESAEKFFLRALQVSPMPPSYKIMAGLAKLYTKLECEECADSLFKSALHSNDLALRAYVYNELRKGAFTAKNYKKAAEYAHLYISTADSVHNNHLHQEVLKIQKEYDRMQLLYQKTRLENIISFICILAVIIISVFFKSFKAYKKRVQEKNEQLQLEIILLYDTLTKNKTLYEEKQQKFQSQIDTLVFQQKNNIIHTEEQSALQNKIDRLIKEKSQVKETYHQKLEQQSKQLEALLKKKEELEKMNNRFCIIYGKHNSLEIKDIKALQVALNLSKSKTCNLPADREDIKHWLNLSKNGFADKLHITYPMLEGKLLDICYLAAVGLSIDEIAQNLGCIQERSVERYMSLICQSVKYPISGKKGFWKFINSFITV